MDMKKEMTRYAFISHMEDYMKQLLKDPLHADTDDFLKEYGIDGPKAIKILTKRVDPDDENSAVVLISKSIKDNGTDENGKRRSDSFVVKCRIPRKDYTKKMRNLYINLFESNIVDKCPINERVTSPDIKEDFNDKSKKINEDGEAAGATSADASGQYVQPLFGKPIKRRTVYITQEQLDYIKKNLNEEAVMDTAFGNFGFDAPIGDGKKNKDNKFFKDANDHVSIMAKSWPKQ